MRPLEMCARSLSATKGRESTRVVAGRGEVPSLGMNPWTPALLSFSQVRPVDLSAARSLGYQGVALSTLSRPVLLATIGLAVYARPPRRLLMPLFLSALGLLLALGPYLPGPVALPFGWALLLPFFSRFWWADRLAAAAALGLSTLAENMPDLVAQLEGVCTQACDELRTELYNLKTM